MKMPGFMAAEASLYKTSHRYQMGWTRSALGGGREVVAQAAAIGGGGGGLGFNCTPDGKACGCSGSSDCMACQRAGCAGKSCICSDGACACV
jgi:hypothetical protein